MNVKVATIDSRCTQTRETQCCGEILGHGDGFVTVRNYVIVGDGQKIPKLFKSQQKALDEAALLGYTVTE